jgi:DNA invertase Pin-like site-specific DNA recombinase
MKCGYARVSTKDQNLNLQIDALLKAGVAEIHTEIASGSKTERPVLAETLKKLRSDDILVIWKLDRLGRSLRHLVELTGTDFNGQGSRFIKPP